MRRFRKCGEDNVVMRELDVVGGRCKSAIVLT